MNLQKYALKIGSKLIEMRVSLVAQMVKNLPAMWETRLWSLGQEDPPEKGMVTHSTVFPWRIPWTEEPGGLPSMGSERIWHNWATNSFSFILEVVPNFMQICYVYILGEELFNFLVTWSSERKREREFDRFSKLNTHHSPKSIMPNYFL